MVLQSGGEWKVGGWSEEERNGGWKENGVLKANDLGGMQLDAVQLGLAGSVQQVEICLCWCLTSACVYVFFCVCVCICVCVFFFACVCEN